MFGLFGRKSETNSQMQAVNAKGIVCAGVMECACHIRQSSKEKMVVALERAMQVSGAVVIVDLVNGLAYDATITGIKGVVVNADIVKRHDLKGLVPARLGRARDLYNRA